MIIRNAKKCQMTNKRYTWEHTPISPPSPPMRGDAPTRLLELHGRHATGAHQYAVVDADLFDELDAHHWRAKPSASGRTYAIRNVRRPDGGTSTLRLHRVVLGIETGEPVDVFFADGDPLNCTRANLRIGPRSATTRNAAPRRRHRKCCHCGALFATWAPHGRPGFCSDACRHAAAIEAARRRTAAKQAARIPVTCAWCGTDFAPRRSDARYCSKTCRHRAKNARRSAEQNASSPARFCGWCGTSLEGMRADARYCSRSCRSHARHHAAKSPGPPQGS